MLRKIKLLIPKTIKIRNISALYITGDKASENFSVLKPYFDFKRLDNLEELQKNCESRKIPIDIQTLKEHWELYRSIEEKKLILENRRKTIADEIKEIQLKNPIATKTITTPSNAKNTPPPIENPLIEALKTEGITVREALKLLKENTYQIDKAFITKFLNLPNVLHKNTPINEEIIIDSYFDHCKDSHNKTENSHNKQRNIDQLQEYHNPQNYYLKGEAAKFELFVPLNCIEFYQQSSQKFIPISNPDFIKTVIVEGAAHKITDFYQILDDSTNDNVLNTDDDDDDDDESVNEHQRINNLHLIGSGSWLSYLGFITKLIVHSNVLPIKLISTGKRYNCAGENENESIGNLTYRRQETIVQIFVADLNEEKINQTFNGIVEQTIEYYKIFKKHFRIVYVPAHQLHDSESLRISFQMLSLEGKYIEIGHLSQHNDFISKRLLFICKEGKTIHFPYIITGNILNVNNLLEILCENNHNIDSLSEFYQ